MPVTISDFVAGPLSANREDGAIAKRILNRLRGAIPSLQPTPSGRIASEEFYLNSNPPLFDYQQEVILTIQAHIESNERKMMVSLPTGGGKTRTALWLCRAELLKHRIRRVLWVAPSVELIDQAVNELKRLWRGQHPSPAIQVITHDIRSVQPGINIEGCIIFATTQLTSRRLKELKLYNPDLLIIDEAHQAAARTFRELIHTAFCEASSLIIGLSATPGRSLDTESELLADLFNGKLITPHSLGSDPVESLKQRGVLSQVELIPIPFPKQWDQVRVRQSSTTTLSINELAKNNIRFWASVDTAVNIGKRGRCLIFCASIPHCHALGAAIQANGLRTAVLSYNTPIQDREHILRIFRAGGIDVLLNKSILVAGFDLPELEDIILATPIRSAIQWEQIVGRVSRGPAVGGTPHARVWELDDHTSLHARVMSAQRFAGDIW